MEKIIFIELAEAIRIHNGQIEEHGGIYGVRDAQLLDSALNTPQASFSGQYLHKNLYEMAAAYAYHIIRNHPFLDGNKRTGILLALIFLKINGISKKFKQNELYELSIKIATSKISKKEIAQFFREKTVKN